MNILSELRGLSDCDVVGRLDELAVEHRKLGAVIVAHLVVVKERSIHLDLGFPSLVDYCVERLGCSRDVAYKRSAAVGVALERPEVLGWLEAGETTLSALATLAPHRQDATLIGRARGKSKREVKELIAVAKPDPNWSQLQSRMRPVADDRV
jgi:hypothetical protein